MSLRASQGRMHNKHHSQVQWMILIFEKHGRNHHSPSCFCLRRGLIALWIQQGTVLLQRTTPRFRCAHPFHGDLKLEHQKLALPPLMLYVFSMHHPALHVSFPCALNRPTNPNYEQKVCLNHLGVVRAYRFHPFKPHKCISENSGRADAGLQKVTFCGCARKTMPPPSALP